MTAQALLIQEFPPQHTPGKTKKRIQVQGCDGGYATIPHSLLRASIKLSGVKSNVFFYIWERTVSFRKFEEEMDFQEFVCAIDACARTIREAIRWLRDNSWITVRANGSRPSTYGIDEKLLEDAGCLVDMEEDARESEEISVVNSAKQTRFPSSYRRKKKDTYRTCNTGTIPVSKKVATCDQVSGAFQIIKNTDPPMVREMIRFGVNRKVILDAIRDKGEDWVRRIYLEFNHHCGQRHNMRSKPAVLAHRLKDYSESWREVKRIPSSSENSESEPAPGLLRHEQRKIENQGWGNGVLSISTESDLTSEITWIETLQKEVDANLADNEMKACCYGHMESAAEEHSMTIQEVFGLLDCHGHTLEILKGWQRQYLPGGTKCYA